MQATESTGAENCPRCGGPTRAVTSVTVRTLGVNPRRVLVTRRCTGSACQLKFPLLKRESELTPAERACWHEG
jgi:hypothetical protein